MNPSPQLHSVLFNYFMQRKQSQFLNRISAVIDLGKIWEIRVLKFEFGKNQFRALGTFLLVCVSSLGSKELQKPIKND